MVLVFVISVLHADMLSPFLQGRPNSNTKNTLLQGTPVCQDEMKGKALCGYLAQACAGQRAPTIAQLLP